MTLKGWPILIEKGSYSKKSNKGYGLCHILGLSKWTLAERLKSNAYPLLKWINDNGTMKVVRSSLERQLDSMTVKV